ncbi:MAG: hypothetical protein KatS3mg035_2214 [Bacteroidia bacterium]|nr:MAG: hypothetical protein KatS3mg035_2214 [Bacteroidia bacterium]
MEGRNLEITNYRFGFQGQEGDDEVFGKNNLWAYKYRLHDARLGRFFSVDPLADKYPYNSVYAFSENRVIDGVELEGLERLVVITPILFGEDLKLIRTQQTLDIERYMAQIGVSLIYPSASMQVGEFKSYSKNISSISSRLARKIALNGNMSVGIGSERNALRHVLWQAIITQKFGREIAEKIGNAHEGIKYAQSAYVDFNLPLVQDKYVADEIVDFLNNSIGREIGENLDKNLSSIEIAKIVLEYQKNNGFWVVNEIDGKLKIEKVKITQEQYEQGLKNLENLDEYGFNEEERKKMEENN